MSKQSFTYSLDYLVELTLLFSVPVLMPKIEDFTKLLMIIAPYAILAVLLQVVEIILGFQIIHLFNPAMIAYQGVFNSAGDTPVDMIRPIELCYTALLIIILGLSIIRLKKVPINRVFILVTIALSVISLLMTGTRTWFLGMIAGVLYYFIKLKAINKTTIVTLLIPGIMIIIASFYIGVVGGQISDAVGRYGTLELLFGGDQTAGGTLIRVTERGPRVMDEFFQSTIIFGDALSDRFYEFGDEHVGYQNILLNAGFFGCLIFVFFLYRLYVVPFNVQRTLNSQNPYKDILKISFMGLICLLVINSGVQVIGFTIGPLKMLFLAIIVAFISSATFASRESEIMIRESNKKYLLSKKIAQEVK